MGKKSDIEWTESTWSPIRARAKRTGKVGWHCEHVTTGCINCYSEAMNKRFGTGLPFKPGHQKDIELFLDENMLSLPLQWKDGQLVFVCSMTDLFADFVEDEWIDRVMAVMALTPRHTFQILTKRPKRMRAYFEERWGDNAFWRVAQLAREEWPELFDDSVLVDANWWPLRNVWLGTSTERQLEADERIPDLLSTPAFVHFISAEPLLGPVDVSDFLTCPVCRGYGFTARLGDRKGDPCTRCVRLAAKYGKSVASGGFARLKVGLDWVICGGESGPGARPMQPEWARFLRDQCQRAGVPFFLKQMAKRRPIPDDLFIREMPAKEAAA